VTPLIVVILAVMWIAVLVPPLLRSRTDGRPSSSIAGFRRQLSTLQSSAPSRSYGARPATAYRPTAAALRPARANQQRLAIKRRRQNILVGLAAMFALSGAIGFAKGIPLAKTVCLASALLLAGYVYLLVQIRKNAQARTLRYEWSSRAA
jgi:hypothetical protein